MEKGCAQRTRLAIKIIEGPNSGEAGRIRKLSDDARNATKRRTKANFPSIEPEDITKM